MFRLCDVPPFFQPGPRSTNPSFVRTCEIHQDGVHLILRVGREEADGGAHQALRLATRSDGGTALADLL